MRQGVMRSSKEPASASAGQALTRAPIGPSPMPCAKLAPMVATISAPRRPACQWWYRLVLPTGLEDEHARRQDQAIRGEWGKPGCQAGLAVRTDQFEPGPVR
jgi:hypothetical protein